jgi:hypothetical protein
MIAPQPADPEDRLTDRGRQGEGKECSFLKKRTKKLLSIVHDRQAVLGKQDAQLNF